MKESDFQKRLIKELTERYDGCIVMKNDANHIQGIPDLTVLYKNHWAALECKKDEKACIKSQRDQMNQKIYVDKMDVMSYAKYIYPENKNDILHELDEFFES